MNIFTTVNGESTSMPTSVYEYYKLRRIMLFSEINPVSAADINSQLRCLMNESDEPITIVINSPGGEIYSGYSILDSIEDCQNRGIVVNTVVCGMAASMASMILMAGTPGHRFATPRSTIMIHQPLGGVEGQATEIQIVCERILELKSDLVRYISKKTKKSKEEISRDLERDHWMKASEAKSYGIVDEIKYITEVDENDY